MQYSSVGGFCLTPSSGRCTVPLFNLHPQVCGNPETVMASNKGRALYMALTESITLDHIMRQQGEDTPAVQYCKVISNLLSMMMIEPFHKLSNIHIFAIRSVYK